MVQSLQWRLLLHVAHAQKAKRVMEQVAAALGHEIEATRSQPYWKDADLFEVTFETSLRAHGPEVAAIRAGYLCI